MSSVGYFNHSGPASVYERQKLLNLIFIVKNTELTNMFSLNLKGRLWLVEKPQVMGILNITPDSFYEGSRLDQEDAVLKKAGQMLNEGAGILDIGGQSTRPGSGLLVAEDELRRVIPAIEIIHSRFPEAIISVDTFYSRVAIAAVNAGASMVNDVSAGNMDPEMLTAVANLKVPYICMHMPGTPQTMQQLNSYENLLGDIISFLALRIQACRKAGMKDIIADPGFGFGKNPEQNFQLLNRLEDFQVLQVPLLVGLSRKSTVYKTLGTNADHALNGTTVLHTMAILKKASILRVHDVREAVEVIKLMEHLSA